MEFGTWEPVYETIVADFGFDRAADEYARDRIADLTEPFDVQRLACHGQRVAITGAGPSLEANADRARSADAVFAAATSATRLLATGVDVDCMVTDMDEPPATARSLTERGVPVVAHAHGDNLPAVRWDVPSFVTDHVLATTQAAPVGHVLNFGGFTDGDRAAFLADTLGADELVFVGFDFDDPAVNPIKARKLVWAQRLLHWLERRRGQRFDVLDGRRDGIDTTALPLERDEPGQRHP
jgi:uncharacterized Rossmann fold enzyme